MQKDKGPYYYKLFRTLTEYKILWGQHHLLSSLTSLITDDTDLSTH